MRILRNKTSRFESLNRQRRVGLGVLTPPRPSDVSSMPGGGVRTPSPTFRFEGRGSFNYIVTDSRPRSQVEPTLRNRFTLKPAVTPDRKCVIRVWMK